MKNWFLWLVAGVLACVGGILALLNPLSAAVAATTLAGWALILMGGIQAYSAWKSEGFRPRLGAGLAAIVAFFMGVLLLLGPFGEGRFLQIALALLLIVSGVAKIWSARQIRGDRLFPAVLAAGAVSLLLGLAVLSGFPGVLATNLGVLLGLELLANGVTLVVLALSRRKTAPAS